MHTRASTLGLFVLLLALGGCGFHLQGRMPLPTLLQAAWLDVEDTQSDFVHALRTSLSGSGMRLTTQAQPDVALIRITHEQVTERVLTVSARNIPTDYELTFELRLTVRAEGRDLITAEELSLSRVYSFDESKLLAKEREKEILLEALARDMASRRAAATVVAVEAPHVSVLQLSGVDRIAVAQLLARFELTLRLVAAGEDIPGSYWGETEAGLKASTLYARLDTPLHSVLHESAHYICMTPERRAGLDRDAGGDDAEESAVCYLQVLLAEQLPQFGRARAFGDMDDWGYSFRLGNTAAWFEQDADDARLWLFAKGIVDSRGVLTGALRC